MAKEIEELTEEDLMELWGVIGGTPHLFEYGKDELKSVLITGECADEDGSAIGLSLGYYTMAAIVDTLRERGFKTSEPKPEDGMINKHLQLIKELGFYHELKRLLELQREVCLNNIMDTDFYRKHKNDFPKSYITHAAEPDELKQWEHFKPAKQ